MKEAEIKEHPGRELTPEELKEWQQVFIDIEESIDWLE